MILALSVIAPAPPADAAPPGPTIVDVALMINSAGPFADEFFSRHADLDAYRREWLKLVSIDRLPELVSRSR